MRFSFAVLLIALLGGCVPASTDIHLEVGQPLVQSSLLEASTHRYVRYLVTTDGARKLLDIWSRRLTVEVPPAGGQRAIHIHQRWDRADGTRVLAQDSWFEEGTLRPLTHVQRVDQDGKATISGFRFTDREIVGMKDLTGNRQADFKLDQDEAHFNFIYDQELLQTLPLTGGRQFDIPFYDPGADRAPNRYKFVVAGSARVRGPDGKSIDCWLVTTDYNKGKIKARFWLAKRNQIVIREERYLDDGSLLLKALLPPEPSDEWGPDEYRR